MADSDHPAHRFNTAPSASTHDILERLLLPFSGSTAGEGTKRLLDEFGSIGAMLAASPERLLRVTGGDMAVVSALSVFREAMQHTLRSQVAEKPHLSSLDALFDYLRASMAFGLAEQVRVLHLNSRNLLIRDEVMFTGTIDEAAIHVREVIRRALELGSSAIIVVHNHPSGDPAPSRADIDVTRKLAEAGRRIGVSLHDHIIVAAGGHSSLRAMGLL